MKTYQTPTAEVVSFHSTSMLAISLWHDFADNTDALSNRQSHSTDAYFESLDWENEEDW